MDDIVRKDIPPETPNDRLTTPHLPARDPKDQVEQPDTRGRALTHAQHQSHGGQPNSPRHHQQIGASRLKQAGNHSSITTVMASHGSSACGPTIQPRLGI